MHIAIFPRFKRTALIPLVSIAWSLPYLQNLLSAISSDGTKATPEVVGVCRRAWGYSACDPFCNRYSFGVRLSHGEVRAWSGVPPRRPRADSDSDDFADGYLDDDGEEVTIETELGKELGCAHF